MATFKTNSATQTEQLAQQLAERVKDGGILTLSGPLGSGKTTFCQGLAKALRIKDRLISPTFILIRSYPLPHSSSNLYHVDLYRLNSLSQIKQLGIEEIFQDPGNIVLIEWPERVKKLLPKKALNLKFKTLGENKREIKVS